MIHAMGPRPPIDVQIAEKVSAAEIKFQYAITRDWIEAYRIGWGVLDQTLDMLGQPDRPAVWPRGSEPR
jgi:hypothetical protein